MTGPAIDIAKWVAESRAAQGLPPRVTDSDALRRVAQVVASRRGGDAA